MTKKNIALQICIDLLHDQMRKTTDNDMADVFDAAIIKAKEALASNELDDYDISILGPDGIPLHPEPYENMQEAIKAAAYFPLRYAHVGYYVDCRRERIPMQELPERIELSLTLKEEEEVVCD
jgi:hypothetical protein